MLRNHFPSKFPGIQIFALWTYGPTYQGRVAKQATKSCYLVILIAMSASEKFKHPGGQERATKGGNVGKRTSIVGIYCQYALAFRK